MHSDAGVKRIKKSEPICWSGRFTIRNGYEASLTRADEKSGAGLAASQSEPIANQIANRLGPRGYPFDLVPHKAGSAIYCKVLILLGGTLYFHKKPIIRARRYVRAQEFAKRSQFQARRRGRGRFANANSFDWGSAIPGFTKRSQISRDGRG